MVRLEGVAKTFPGKSGAAALAGVDLAVAEGSILAIVGRSGAGKSTLLRAVNLLERPDAGRVLVGGTDLTALPEPELRRARRGIGMIFQHFNLLANRTAAGNVALSLELAGWDRARIAPRVAELLELVGLEGKAERYPAELSGGQKQRVGIARALAAEPKVLLCDEATSALDPETTAQILDLIGRINRRLGLTVLLVTHEMAVVRQVADRVVVLEAGRIVEEGEVEAVFARPRHPTTRSFLARELGAELPADAAARLRPDPQPGGATVVRAIALGEAAVRPVLFQAAARAGAEIALLAGRIEPLRGRPFAAYVAELSGPAPAQEAALAALRAAGIEIEVLGYDATALRAAG
ncbi:MAG TPA: ATP-binding cassette domain-containing protein [Azospirillaceae bacterium]|nr:ATP-binding cassette domain-containing protein [Azospirillaceae bacterium]